MRVFSQNTILLVGAETIAMRNIAKRRTRRITRILSQHTRSINVSHPKELLAHFLYAGHA